MNQFKLLLTFFILLAFTIAVSAQPNKQSKGILETGGTLSFSVTTVTQNGTYAPKHVLAIWIEKNNQFVKTRVAYANARKQYLYTWKAKSNYNVTDAITGPTLSSHQTRTATWDCKDLSGNIVPDGEYVLWIEFTEKHAQGPLYSIPFTKGPQPQSITPPDQTNFKNMSLTFTPVSANFNANQTSVCVDENVIFTSTSSGATAYNWNFGSGAVPATANTAGPHTVHYTTAGAKTVSLTINASVVETKQNYISVAEAPQAGFDFEVSSYTAEFSNNSTNATSYLWNFGDGGTSTDANPTHIYADAGSYTVTLSSSNATCDPSTVNHVVAVPVIANFTASDQELCMNENVVFTSTSSNATSYLWNFGDGANPSTANTVGPHTIQYGTSGSKTISLTINGNIVETKTGYISVLSPPVSSFTFQINGMTVNFTNNSTNATSYLWDFGDGNSSTELNPVHTYLTSGTFNVILVASNSACSPSSSFSDVSVTNVGVNDTEQNSQIQILLNDESVMVTSTSLKPFAIEVVDLNGRIIKRESGNGQINVDIRNLVKGLYVLKVNEEAINKNYKFVID